MALSYYSPEVADLELLGRRLGIEVKVTGSGLFTPLFSKAISMLLLNMPHLAEKVSNIVVGPYGMKLGLRGTESAIGVAAIPLPEGGYLFDVRLYGPEVRLVQELANSLIRNIEESKSLYEGYSPVDRQLLYVLKQIVTLGNGESLSTRALPLLGWLVKHAPLLRELGAEKLALAAEAVLRNVRENNEVLGSLMALAKTFQSAAAAATLPLARRPLGLWRVLS